jgi:hypothetical protein
MTQNPHDIDTKSTHECRKLIAGLADAPHTLSALAPDTGVTDQLRRTMA